MVTGLPTHLLRPAAQESLQADDQRLREVTREFETMFVEMILTQMRSANRELSNQEVSFTRQTYESWQDQHLAKSLSGGQGLGLGEMLYRQLQEQQLRQAPPVVES